MESVIQEDIRNRLQVVRDKIRAAAAAAGRDPAEVTLVAVSKKKPVEAIRAAYGAGTYDFGENYVQELREKQAVLTGPDIRWHMIGHLQKNKIKYLIGNVGLIHSVDTVSLAEAIQKEAAARNAVMNILLEVNVAEEASKWGFSVQDVQAAAEAIAPLQNIRLLGLMTSAPYTENPEENRPYFRTLKAVADRLFERGLIAGNTAGFGQPVLSMGMSNDYEIAVEEGATLVRVGTAIFGERQGGTT